MTTSTSSDPVIVKDVASRFEPGPLPDLRAGTWTRLAGAAALGDAATEVALRDVAEEVRDVARAQGYAAGWAGGRRRAQAEAEARRVDADRDRATELARWAEQQQTLLSALASAADSCGSDLATRYAELTELAVDLALEIAEAVIGREVENATDGGVDAVRRVLSELAPGVTTTVRLNPADLASIDRGLLAGTAIELVADPTVGRGDALAETQTGLIDASLATAMARVREVLGR